jgi:formamidopyrimidine-DNA glycosylase
VTRNHLLCLHLDKSEDLRVVENSTQHRVAVHLVTDPRQVAWIAELGLDPLGPEFTLGRFRQAAARRNRTVKKLLTDQRAIGGIGNCYSDEILFEARLSPFRTTVTLKVEEAIRLFTATRKVLTDAILQMKSLDHLPDRRDRTFLRVHGRVGQPCPVCANEIQRISYVDSTTYYCPGCQTGGEILADRRFSKLLK